MRRTWVGNEKGVVPEEFQKWAKSAKEKSRAAKVEMGLQFFAKAISEFAVFAKSLKIVSVMRKKKASHFCEAFN